MATENKHKGLMIVLPEVTTSVTIAAEWFERRDGLVARAAAIAAVATVADADAAGETIRALAKTGNELEAQRKQITDPFLKAQRTIKAEADKAAAPLAAEEARLKGMVGTFVAAERRRVEEEERAAEAERRDKIQAQVDQQQSEAELLGTPFDEPPVVVVPEAAPVARVATVCGVRTQEYVAFEVVNSGEVPRRFLVLSEALIREDVKSNEAALLAKLKDDPGFSNIPGVKLRIETRVGSR